MGWSSSGYFESLFLRAFGEPAFIADIAFGVPRFIGEPAFMALAFVCRVFVADIAVGAPRFIADIAVGVSRFIGERAFIGPFGEPPFIGPFFAFMALGDGLGLFLPAGLFGGGHLPGL